MFFQIDTNTFPFVCGSNGKHLIINLSSHTCILFILNPLPYNIKYLFWLVTSYNYSFFTTSMWSYHWQPKYPFASVPLREWTYNNPQCILEYYCNCCFEEWSTCSIVSHLLPCHTQQRMDILITKDDFWTLMNIIIVDPIHTNIMQ
jgi:hypothetical protein